MKLKHMKDLLKKSPRKTGKLRETADKSLEMAKKPFRGLISWLSYQDQSKVLNFSEIVEDTKIEAGLNQVEMAAVLGISKGTFSKWLDKPPKYYKVEKLLYIAKTKPDLEKPTLSPKHISRKVRLFTGIFISIALLAVIGITVENIIAIQQHTGSWSPWSVFDAEAGTIDRNTTTDLAN